VGAGAAVEAVVALVGIGVEFEAVPPEPEPPQAVTRVVRQATAVPAVARRMNAISDPSRESISACGCHTHRMGMYMGGAATYREVGGLLRPRV
jgi:hypothetical protein